MTVIYIGLCIQIGISELMAMPDLKKNNIKMGKLSHERAEFLIPTQAFIYCKYNSNDAKQSNIRLSHIYHTLFN